MDVTLAFSEMRPRSIAVFRALRLGDMLCAVPALRALKACFPGAKISLLSLPWAREFAHRYSHFIDEFVPFPGFPGLIEQEFDPNTVKVFFDEMQIRNFDLAFQMHGSGEVSNVVTLLLKAKVSIGHTCRREIRTENAMFFTYPQSGSEICRNMNLLNKLGLKTKTDDLSLEFPITPEERWGGARLREQLRLQSKQYFCVHPGARDSKRRWDPAAFADVANAVLAKGFEVVITGNKEESGLAAEVQRRTAGRCMDVTYFDLPLGILADLIAGARGICSNDTGVSHLAVALTIPSVVVFTLPELMERWAPLASSRHRAVDGKLKRKVQEEVLRLI